MNSNNKTRDGLLMAAAGAGLFCAARMALRLGRRMDFRGRTVLITGGSRGLGLLLARRFADERARVVICARDPGELERAAEDLRRRGAEVLSVQCDVTRPEELRELVVLATGRFGGIDVLVNNAGTITVGPMEVMTVEDFEEAMRTHFWAPLHATLAVLPSMRARGGGRIVNITSIGGKVPVPHLLPYTASKFALVGLSEGLRSELMKDGIYVTTIAPGLMRTGSHGNAMFKGQNRAEFALFSISDSLPITSMNADRAARRIIRACRYGEPEVVLSVQAKAAALFHGVCPGLWSDLNALLARALPSPGPDGRWKVPGHASGSKWAPSWATALSDRAAVANNEV